jgi:hypothetical protein
MTFGEAASTNKTLVTASGALTVQLGSQEIHRFPLLQNCSPETCRPSNDDQFFSAQQRLVELMTMWRMARDRGAVLLHEQQLELEVLI